MRKLLVSLALAAVVSFTSGCATMSRHGDKIGAVAGAAIGYAVGGDHKIIAALVGGFAGYKIGDKLAERFGQRDVAQFDNTLRNNAPGQTARWGAADGGYYELTPRGNGYRPQAGGKEARNIPANQLAGSYCREFSVNIVMLNKTEQGIGVACLMPDGAWRIVG